ncbi:hypothetical protein O181_081568 [Austropuccinia psidii MF-1]|uniref:Uncharacterized protein n=1 Tax=Austropuccinia psidii MF-1 TaxID=1389203 RepID=A0A9Q3IHL9_9BASI|nr:hypothetical protein [Austropuccinia psidii MF-1]
MAIHLLGSPYGISSHSLFTANYPYPSPVANMATSSSYGPFMALHLNPEAIAAIYAQLGISGHFPQNQEKCPKWLFLAIWAHNTHFCAYLRTLRICAYLRIFVDFVHFDAKCRKDTFLPFGPVFGSEPKSGQKPQRTQKSLSKL